MRCLNPDARSCRLHDLSKLGMACHLLIREDKGLPVKQSNYTDLDWALYGSLCYRHRSLVIRMLNEPLRPMSIKRKALLREPGVRLSSNNVRDVIRYLKAHRIVEPLYLGKDKHPHYQLTEKGWQFRDLLTRALLREW